jgi:hypothetical protein
LGWLTISLLAAAILCVLPVSVFADAEIGTSGSGAGQTLNPRDVAVDEDDDLLYVADTGNDRIAVFDATSGAFIRAFGWGVADGVSNELQVCTTTCFKGIGGTGPGQLDAAIGIAVDNDSTSAGYHDVYVFESSGGAEPNFRVQKFTPAGGFVWMAGGEVNKTTNGDLCTKASGNTCGAGKKGNDEGSFNETVFGSVIDVGPGGIVYVGDQLEEVSPRPSRIQKFAPSGAYLEQLVLPVSGGSGRATSVAVDAAGNIFMSTSGANGAVRKYSPTGTELFAVNPSFNLSAIAVDAAGNLLVADIGDLPGSSQFVHEIRHYNGSTGAPIRVFYGTLSARAVGLVVYPTPNGDVIVAEEAPTGKTGRVVTIPFPPLGPMVYPRSNTVFASPIGNVKATLHSVVNPEGEPTTYHFEYISDEDFVAAGETFGAGTQETAESSSIGNDFELHQVEEEITGLFPETTYHFRAVAKNASGESIGPVGEFTTKDPLEFGEQWSTDVDTQSATLHAEVNPLGIPATARFEYVELSEYEATEWENAQSAPSGEPIDLGEGEAMKEVSTTVSGLKERTSYRYRVVATNRCDPEPAPLCDFREPEGTFTTFATLQPIEGCANDALRAAGSGEFLPDCRGYEMVSPVDKNGSSVESLYNNLNFPAALDQAALNGDSITYSTYKAFGDVESAPYINQYLARRDAATGWQTEAISPKREGPSLMNYESNQLDRQYKLFSEDLCDGWLIQDANPPLAPGGVADYPGLYHRDNCAPETGSFEALAPVQPPNQEPRKFLPEPQGASADGSVVIFLANDNLTPDAPPQPPACVAGSSPSTDPCERRLYESRGEDLALVCILPDDSAYPGSCSPGQTSLIDNWKGRASLLTNAISEDGSRIFWTAARAGAGALYVRIDGTETVEVSSSPSTKFWTASADGSTAIYTDGDKLFEFDVDTEVKTQIAEGFIGFAGASEDASRLYFASSKVLTGEDTNSEGDKAEAGKPNLYLYEAGSGFSFIGTLLSSDASGFGNPVEAAPGSRLSRVTASGEQIAFMSAASLTGYDNKDAVTGEPDMEVFFYNAASEDLLCPSCNPSKARAEGRQLTQKFLTNRRAAARIPTFISHLYGQRVISEDGNRLYFNSFESLVSRDTNGEEDVYQWQAVGTGGPKGCDTTSPTYNEASSGCVDLISSGQSPKGSELVDISADGDDVFIRTYESLVTQDPALRDIYDVRVGGGFPPLPAKPVICEGEFCPEPAKPNPPAPPPAATSLVGPGNPVWPKPKPKARKCPKGKHKVKAKGGKARCVKNKKKKAANKRNKANQSRRAGR